MRDRNSRYFKGPEAEHLQRRYRRASSKCGIDENCGRARYFNLMQVVALFCQNLRRRRLGRYRLRVSTRTGASSNVKVSPSAV